MEPHRPPLVREAVLDGIFYPQAKSHLREAVRTLLLRSEEVAGTAAGIVSPHGSFQYSGLHLATAFKAVAARTPKLICVIGAATRNPKRTPAVPESEFFRSPLGDSPVDRQLCLDIGMAGAEIHRDDIPHFEEPSIETPLPFIQFLFPDVPLLPLLIPNLSAQRLSRVARRLSEATRGLDNGEILWICSTNISRGGNEPAVRRRADNLLDMLESGSVASLLTERAARGYPAATCLALFTTMLGESHSVEVLTRGSSFDIDGNHGASTEYASVAVRNL